MFEHYILKKQNLKGTLLRGQKNKPLDKRRELEFGTEPRRANREYQRDNLREDFRQSLELQHTSTIEQKFGSSPFNSINNNTRDSLLAKHHQASSATRSNEKSMSSTLHSHQDKITQNFNHHMRLQIKGVPPRPSPSLFPSLTDPAGSKDLDYESSFDCDFQADMVQIMHEAKKRRLQQPLLAVSSSEISYQQQRVLDEPKKALGGKMPGSELAFLQG